MFLPSLLVIAFMLLLLNTRCSFLFEQVINRKTVANIVQVCGGVWDCDARRDCFFVPKNVRKIRRIHCNANSIFTKQKTRSVAIKIICQLFLGKKKIKCTDFLKHLANPKTDCRKVRACKMCSQTMHSVTVKSDTASMLNLESSIHFVIEKRKPLQRGHQDCRSFHFVQAFPDNTKPDYTSFLFYSSLFSIRLFFPSSIIVCRCKPTTLHCRFPSRNVCADNLPCERWCCFCVQPGLEYLGN